MSHVDPGPLATYESLSDPHLSGYFNNTRMRHHLKRMGLITRRGEIVSEKVFRLNNARKEHQRHIRDVLSQAIVHKALDMERHRQMHIKRQLEEIAKIERVRRVRAERALRGDEDILPLLSPRAKQHKKKNSKKEKVPILQTVADSEEYEQRPPQSVGYPAMPAGPPYNTRADRIEMQYPPVEVDNQHLYGLDRDALRSFTLNLSQFDLGSGVSPYSMPREEVKPPKRKPKRRPATSSGVPTRPRIRPASNARSLKLHRREPPMMHRAQVHTLTRVTFKYLGQMVHLDHEEEDPRDEVMVMQQHCGGENIRIFKGMVMKGDKFVVISRRHRTFPFSLTFYLNGVQVERLSTCCEYKHKTGHKLGAKSSHFGIIKIDGYQPCFKCLISQGKLKTRPDPTPPPSGGRTQPSNPRRPKKKLKGVDKKEEEYTDDFQESSKSSTTTEEVQTDGPKAPSEASSSEISAESSPLTSETEESDSDTETDTESNLPSLKQVDSDTSDTESIDSQKKSKPAFSKGRVKSPKPRASSAGKKSMKTPSKAESKPHRIENIAHPDRSQTPTPIKAEPRSPPPPILKVEKSSSSSDKDHDKQRGSTRSDSVSSLSDAVEESRNEVKSSSSDDEEKRKALLLEASQLTGHTSLPERPPSPEPESSSSETESVKSGSDSSKDQATPILPLVKGKSHVSLKSRQLTTSHVQELVKYFNEDPASLQIRELILSNCGIDDTSSKLMLKAILRSSSLETLDVSGNKLSHGCIGEILEVCYKNPIQHLYLGSNPLGDSGCQKLMDGLMKSQEAIVTAKLQKKVSQTLIASVLKDTRKELSGDMASSVSSASSMTSLASSTVGDNVILQSLDMSNTSIGHESFVSVGHFLNLNPKLSHLNLSGNSMNMNGLELIINPLTDDTNKNLKSLLLDNCGIDDAMAELIAENLIVKSKMTLLSMKGNRITEVGRKKLDERHTNSSLDKLLLD